MGEGETAGEGEVVVNGNDDLNDCKFAAIEMYVYQRKVSGLCCGLNCSSPDLTSIAGVNSWQHLRLCFRLEFSNDTYLSTITISMYRLLVSKIGA
jgi:hypothetical protein